MLNISWAIINLIKVINKKIHVYLHWWGLKIRSQGTQTQRCMAFEYISADFDQVSFRYTHKISQGVRGLERWLVLYSAATWVWSPSSVWYYSGNQYNYVVKYSKSLHLEEKRRKRLYSNYFEIAWAEFWMDLKSITK